MPILELTHRIYARQRPNLDLNEELCAPGRCPHTQHYLRSGSSAAGVARTGALPAGDEVGAVMGAGGSSRRCFTSTKPPTK